MQEISSLPVYAGVIPNKATQNDYDFANNIFGFINYSGNTLIPFFNDTITDLNILSGQINTKADEVATNTQTVSDKTALVQSITASLPAGTVLDSQVGATSTWSSSKIKTLLDNITAIITSSDTSLDSFQEIVAYIKQNKTVLDTLSISNIAGLTSALSGKLGVNDTAANASKLNGQIWNWSGQGGQPNWLWGGTDGTNMYVYNPANFSVNYANSSNYANSAGVANSISAAVAGSAIANLPFGDIGTNATLARGDSYVGWNPSVSAGTLYAGSEMRPARTGTWKAMESVSAVSYGEDTWGQIKAQFLRIS